MSPAAALLLTCEHAGRRVPNAYRDLFAGAEEVLASHRGWDPGALPVARALAERLGTPLLMCPWTRLLVEANRTPGHPAFFSSWTRELPPAERRRIRERYWEPHRRRVEARVRTATAGEGRLVHVAVHTFTPVLYGVRREVDVGLLYDPARRREKELARRLRLELRSAGGPGLRIRRNHPYRGVSDGLTTWLRRRVPEARYLGMELEVNQALVARPGAARASVTEALAVALARVLGL